ncbi:UNVERIFIED_CONTAM: uncharacterized membrane protein YbaN (DUF454 family) [Brevibacillus sp. OAP136]
MSSIGIPGLILLLLTATPILLVFYFLLNRKMD